MAGCRFLEADRLSAWTDGEVLDLAERESIAAHVRGCPDCEAESNRVRTLRLRMARYSASSATTVPAGFFRQLGERLDAVDQSRTTSTPAFGRRLRWSAAVLAVAVVGAAAILLSLFAPLRVVDPLVTMKVGSSLSARHLESNDPDEAARWLSGELGAEVPPINLSLLGARLDAANADKGEGHLHYTEQSGKLLSLRIIPRSRLKKTGLLRVLGERQSFWTMDKGKQGESIVAWESGQDSFVASAETPLDKLLPYAQEIARRCPP